MLGEKGWGRKAKVLMRKRNCRRRGLGWEMGGPGAAFKRAGPWCSDCAVWRWGAAGREDGEG